MQGLSSPQSPFVSQQPGIGSRLHVTPLQVAGLQTEVEQGVQESPQWATSLLLTQSPPQLWNPAWQVKPQLPPAQVAVALGGAVQALPHAPQWARSVRMFVSQPLASLLSQFRQSPAQVPSAQVPSWQAALACGKLHTSPHLPQLVASVWRSTQVPEQSVRSLAQAGTHWPSWQVSPSGQVPQLWPQPSSPPQTRLPQEGVQGGGEVVGTQLPARQLPPGQATPSGSAPLHLPCLRFLQGGQGFDFLPFFLSACAPDCG